MNLLQGKRAPTTSTPANGRRNRSRRRRSTRASTSPRPPRTATSAMFPRRRHGSSTRSAAYVHVCTNETIGGVEYHWTPETGDVPLVADMSSHILSRVDRRVALRRDLRRRAEEHRAGRADARHRARRPARPGAADHAVGVPLEGAGGGRLDAEYAADLRDLHRRARVRVAAGAGRRRGDRAAQHRKGEAALRLARCERAST